MIRRFLLPLVMVEKTRWGSALPGWHLKADRIDSLPKGFQPLAVRKQKPPGSKFSGGFVVTMERALDGKLSRIVPYCLLWPGVVSCCPIFFPDFVPCFLACLLCAFLAFVGAVVVVS